MRVRYAEAVDDATRWVLDSGYGNVLIEINNEANVLRYEHEILQPHRVAELVERAKSHEDGGRRLLVGHVLWWRARSG